MGAEPDRRPDSGAAISGSERELNFQTFELAHLGANISQHQTGEQLTPDIDLVVLADDVELYVAGTHWVRSAAGRTGRIVRSMAWGPVSERRVKLASGLLVEYGFAPTSWASVDPVDGGTATVVSNGFRILYDPDGMLDRLATAVARLRA